MMTRLRKPRSTLPTVTSVPNFAPIASATLPPMYCWHTGRWIASMMTTYRAIRLHTLQFTICFSILTESNTRIFPQNYDKKL